MNNLDKIRKAWDMGWSAEIKIQYDEFVVIGIPLTGLSLKKVEDDKVMDLKLIGFGDEQEIKNIEITSYLYAGELAGNEIPEGQKFRHKETGLIGTVAEPISIFTVSLDMPPGTVDWVSTDFDKSEIEPYFEGSKQAKNRV